jgi:hypothetical protein
MLELSFSSLSVNEKQHRMSSANDLSSLLSIASSSSTFRRFPRQEKMKRSGEQLRVGGLPRTHYSYKSFLAENQNATFEPNEVLPAYPGTCSNVFLKRMSLDLQ